MRPLLRVALATTLLACAGLALWPEAPAVVVAPAQRMAPPARATATPASASTTADPAPSTTPQLPTRAGDWPAPPPTALAAWQAPAPPPPLAASRQAEAARAAAARPLPTFPYRWIGQLDDGSTPQVLLGNAQRTLALRLGDTLDGRWRLQRGANGRLQALALASGDAVAVPGAPSGLQP